ncbi:hypothetical protein H0H87_001054 [Tephrocybe sp. NHM501043]|nr:hypothetical protein H0H87_001054 [Tephrocybe sp. NHM501043]
MYPYQIQAMLSSSGNRIEWYRVLLGGGKKKATAAKKVIVEVLEAYAALPEHATTAQLNAYHQSVFKAFKVAMGALGMGLNDKHITQAGEFLEGHSTAAH